MTLSATQIANLALAEVPHGRITDISENSVAAEAVREQLPQVLGELLEGGEWGFAIKRFALTPITNDRSDVWSGAFAVPNDLAMPLKVLPSATATGSAIVSVGQRVAYARDLDLFPISFDYEGATIWTNEASPVLEYVVSNPSYSRFSRTFERVLALTLAGRIALPLTQKTDRKDNLLGEAQLLKQRALARDLNNNPTQNMYGQNYVPSVLMGHVEAPE